MKTLVLDERWNASDSRYMLLRVSTLYDGQKYCCMGLYGLMCGVDNEDLLELDVPSSVSQWPSTAPFTENIPEEEFEEMFPDPNLRKILVPCGGQLRVESVIANVNDRLLPILYKYQKLKELFSRYLDVDLQLSDSLSRTLTEENIQWII